jgi:predicted DNA binding CopG/RHH family protein
MSGILYVRLPDQLLQALKAEAAAQGLTLATYVNLVLTGIITR